MTAEDGITQKTYTITVIRKNPPSITPPSPPAKSNDATLSYLSFYIDSGNIYPFNFDPSVLNYEIDVVNDVSTITVEAKGNSYKSTIDVRVYQPEVTKAMTKTSSNRYELTVGKNIVEISVTAEDGTVKVYNIAITRAGSEVGIEQIKSNTVKVYPSSTNGLVYIETKDDRSLDIKVYSINGKLMLQATQSPIDLSSFAEGVYFIQVNGKNNTKVIKQ